MRSADADHEHHADGREEHQHVVLRRQQPLSLQVAEREQAGGAGDEQDQQLASRSGTGRDATMCGTPPLVRPPESQSQSVAAAAPITPTTREPAREPAVARAARGASHHQQHDQGPAAQEHVRQQRERHAERGQRGRSASVAPPPRMP